MPIFLPDYKKIFESNLLTPSPSCSLLWTLISSIITKFSFEIVLIIDNYLFVYLGLKELFPQAINLKNLLNNTNTEPILIIISAGVDPSQELSELANAVVGAESYVQVRFFSPPYYLLFRF